MIKKAIEYIVGLSEARLHHIEGETYSDKELHRISYNPKAKEIEMNTLSSLVDYIKAFKGEMYGNMIIHVQSPTRVEMYSELDMERKREYMVVVNANVPDFRFNQFIEHESFCINLQSKFMDLPGTDRALILKFAGTVETGTVAEYGDDGKKHVVEAGWFKKGTLLLIQGIRRGNDFVPKKTRSSIYPVISKITNIRDDGSLELQFERMEVEE